MIWAYITTSVGVDFVGDLDRDGHPDVIVVAWDGHESCTLSFNSLMVFDKEKMRSVGAWESGGCM